MFKRLVALNLSVCSLLLLAGTLVLSGCNTMEGAGKDIEAAGDAISDSADDTAD